MNEITDSERLEFLFKSASNSTYWPAYADDEKTNYTCQVNLKNMTGRDFSINHELNREKIDKAILAEREKE